MKVHNVSGLRESLEQLQTEELQEILQAELEREAPDPDSVRLLLRVLEEREIDSTPAEQRDAAWQKYQKKVENLQKKPAKHRYTVAKAASIVAVLGLLLVAVPQQAQAETFWEMLQRWSNNVLEYFYRDRVHAELAYSFQTDNPGLQQVYDAVIELGVTEPVVPMWLPEGFEITEITAKDTPMLNGLMARFAYDDNEIIYRIDVYVGEPAHQYYKDDTHCESYEREGTTYNIARNNDWWVVVWTKDNIECSIAVDCQEDALRRILESIYVMEDV